MNLQTPTTKEVSDNIVAQMQAEFNQVIPLAPKSFIRVLAKVLAGLYVMLFKYGGWSALQSFVSSASIDQTTINGVAISPLTEWGRLVGAGDPISSTQAELGVSVTVTTQGGTLPAGTPLVGANNGVTYLTVSVVALNAAAVFAAVRAVSDQTGGDGSGAIGNLDFGDIISFVNPLGQVEGDTSVSAKTVTGADGETTTSYRQRILDRFQKRPQGGAYADYELWGEEVPGIAAVYPYTGSDPGQVTVYAEAEDTVDGLPTSPQMSAVAAAIELDSAGLATRRPAGALVTVVSIIRTVIGVAIVGLAVDAGQEAQVKADILEALTEYMLGRGPYIVGLTPLPRKDNITDASVSAIVEDIVSAAAGVFTSAKIDEGGSPVVLYTLGEGEKAKLGAVVYS
jgi:hypothetical protein